MVKYISDIETLHNEIIKTKLGKFIKQKKTDIEDTEYFLEDAPEPQYSVGLIGDHNKGVTQND